MKSVTEIKKILRSVGYDVRGREIKTRCTNCGKRFMVDLGKVAFAMVREQNCTCSSCGVRALIPERNLSL